MAGLGGAMVPCLGQGMRIHPNFDIEIGCEAFVTPPERACEVCSKSIGLSAAHENSVWVKKNCALEHSLNKVDSVGATITAAAALVQQATQAVATTRRMIRAYTGVNVGRALVEHLVDPNVDYNLWTLQSNHNHAVRSLESAATAVQNARVAMAQAMNARDALFLMTFS